MTPTASSAPATGHRPATDAPPGAEPAEGGLRERKKRRRRDDMVDAAQRLVLDRGLDAVTVEDVCDAVGVSPRTFFNYFASKDDAVLGLEPFEVRSEAADAFLRGGPTGVLLDDVAHLVGEILGEQAVDTDRMHRTLELVQREPRLLARHVAWIEQHHAGMVELFAARRAARPFVADPELLALVVMSLVRASSIAWQRGDGRGTPADHLADVVEQLRSLLAPDPGD
ncbi:TetR/AcrR family transcriptional regulator [Cellulosimicrobium cellulans]|uniref:TetR/AcrR family transcriptional regulator n=1 Tax=Cellulosimicrobium cellulans TaxID=1710 RepID=UPI000A6D2098|nr:TetR/AcrR family transcriptional regulator [Cellulosimicrobium cellulans]